MVDAARNTAATLAAAGQQLGQAVPRANFKRGCSTGKLLCNIYCLK